MCVHALAHVYTHTDFPLYTCLHMGLDMFAYIGAFLHHDTPTYIQTKTAHVSTDSIHSQVQTSAYQTTFKDLKACTYMPFCTQCTQAHRLPTAINAQQFTGRPLVSSTIGLAQPPLPASPLLQPHDRQLLLLPTPMPAFSFPHPGGPQDP